MKRAQFKRTKSVISIVLSLVLTLSIFAAVPVHAGAAANTWDPANGVYDISTEEDLFAFKDSLWEDIVNKNYFSGITVELKNDIKLTKDWDTLSVENDAEFRGIFKGNNHTISNINCISQDNYCAFFPALYNATIQDLTLSDFTIYKGTYSAAAFAGYSHGDVTISNCHLTGNSLIQRESSYPLYRLNINSAFVSILDEGGTLKIENSTIGENVTIKGDIVGGFVGYNSASEADVYSCVNNGTLCDAENAYLICLGGIMGYSDQESKATIDNCINHGDIHSNTYSYMGIGGIGGCIFTSAITNCYNTGDISSYECTPGVGGIIGVMRSDTYTHNYGSIKNCYNVGKIIGENFDNNGSVGGIAGSLTCDEEVENEISIENCHNFSEVNGDVQSTGQIIGWYLYSAVKSSYSIVGKPAIGKIESSKTTNNVGYFTSADKDGKITYTDIDFVNNTIVETPSAQTDINLLDALNQWVNDKNAELEASGSNFRYLTWKMTNPANEDGSKNVDVHPMFGVEELKTIKFHTNKPGETEDKLFRVYNADDESLYSVEDGFHSFNSGVIEKFYDIPSFAGDEYVFAGWYYNADGKKDGDIPFQFDSEIPGNLTDVYAHWIHVGKVTMDDNDDKVLPGNAKTYSGFKLFGVQIRPEANFDSNYGDGKPGGLRFITSISEELLNNVDALSEKKVNGNKVEYGFVTAATNTVDTFVGDSEYLHLSGEPKADYTLKYKGVNVNGVDTTVKGKIINNYNYVTNVDCTSQKGEFGSNARIKEDHRNYSNYRLATYVVTYDGSEANKGADIVARAYMRYYDANGLLRTFYNNYNGSSKAYGGCSTSYNKVNEIASNTNTAQ